MNGKQKILIADDSEINRALLMEILGDGYEYLEAENGVRAVELLREHTDIALVLLDIMMPQMDGFDVLKVMRCYSWLDEIPVIMISAAKDTANIERAYDLGVADYMRRPFERVMVLRQVQNVLMLYAKQKRLTRGGREFEILKFRSMIVDAEKYAGAVLASEDDPRITKVGKVIRAARLDELPQLINILKGDMSIVAPRPERKCLAEEISKEIPEFCYRLKVRGGLTGYAQIYGKYNTSAYDKLRLDMMYIENYSPLLDIRLIILTLRIIFSKDSTEGIDVAMENQRRADELWRELDEENEEKEKGGAE